MSAGKLANRTCLVSGAGAAGNGIGNGRAIAIRFAREGAHVLAVDRNLELAVATKAMIEAEGGLCTALAADVSLESDVRQMTAAALAVTGRIDVLVNNVGIGVHGGVLDLSGDDWDRVFAVNVKSMFLTSKHVLPGMIANGRGAIVNISSVASIRWAPPPLLAYTASKAAVNALTQAVALEHAAHGIRANAILPGLINTPMIRAPLSQVTDDVDAAIAARGRIAPPGHMGTGWDIAAAAVFLASDEAGYVNGVLLPVDGGLTHQVLAPVREAQA